MAVEGVLRRLWRAVAPLARRDGDGTLSASGLLRVLLYDSDFEDAGACARPSDSYATLARVPLQCA